MGGYGSGTWLRGATKPRQQEYLRLRIGAFFPPNGKTCRHNGTLTWSTDGTPIGSISYRLLGDRVRLSYVASGDKMEYEVRFVQTPCNYGGFRNWFECPCCRRRVGVLYGDRHFLCRHCHGFAYTSQNESRGQRAMRRWDRLTDRVEWLGDCSLKPKGMHWKTYERISDQIDDADFTATFHMCMEMIALNRKLGLSSPELREELLNLVGHMRDLPS